MEYKIGEAAKLLNLKTYVLRFWETEFTELRPHRTETGQRLYSEQDIVLLRTIRHLLHERGLTIEGARKALLEQTTPVSGGSGGPPELANVSLESAVTARATISPVPSSSSPFSDEFLVHIIDELEELRSILSIKGKDFW